MGKHGRLVETQQTYKAISLLHTLINFRIHAKPAFLPYQDLALSSREDLFQAYHCMV
ncbi:hypothetical protein M407DRAFT_116811 [Tulasnella calospora MUT 4182]|uniref:Uncharacterized protein n=1 Tax=Tulasnella calospora MUT 4182 TaxID=1051891 RepID=A0A0C3Q2E2_9AGAM|nr:hypothetical protein M407DRAFT_116811 [Tulasnella calospora MUT 4182]